VVFNVDWDNAEGTLFMDSISKRSFSVHPPPSDDQEPLQNADETQQETDTDNQDIDICSDVKTKSSYRSRMDGLDTLLKKSSKKARSVD
jgi:hypothetical protein